MLNVLIIYLIRVYIINEKFQFFSKYLILIFDIVEIIKNAFNNFLIKFIKIENIFENY